MTHRKAGVISLAFFLTITAFGTAISQDLQSSGFLSDYSQLKETSDQFMGHSYLVQSAEDRMANYTAVMIDQPEIFIAPNSKYKGIKPDDMKVLADAFRTSMSQSLAQDFMIVEQAGPNVLYVRFAITNLQLKKKKKNFLSYTPVGHVAGVEKSAISSDITKKIDLKGLVMEMEVLDSNSEEQLAAAVEVRSGSKEEPASWAELEAMIGVYAQRMRCTLGNSYVAEENRVDCVSDT